MSIEDKLNETVGEILIKINAAKEDGYNDGFKDGQIARKNEILNMVSSCVMRDPTLQKLRAAIEELD